MASLNSNLTNLIYSAYEPTEHIGRLNLCPGPNHLDLFNGSLV